VSVPDLQRLFDELEAAVGSGGGGAATVRVATASFARPSNTTGYDIGDTITASTPAAMSLTGLAGANGGSARLTSAVLKSNKKDFNGVQVRAHLFTVAPTAISADNGTHRILFADAASEIGYIDFPAFAAGTDQTNSTGVISARSDLYLPFVCDAGSDGLQVVLEILNAATPASGQQFHLMLTSEG
jgi:hypothetical protein